MKLGVFGSSAGTFEDVVRNKARALGREIARKGHTLVTGACTGFPHDAVEGAAEFSGKVVGYSPATDSTQHANYFRFPIRGFSEIVYVPLTYPLINDKSACRKYRNISSIANSDACIFIGGRIGTLNEFTIAFDLGKKIGVLQESGGVSDAIIPLIMQKVAKETGARVFFSRDPSELIRLLTES